MMITMVVVVAQDLLLVLITLQVAVAEDLLLVLVMHDVFLLVTLLILMLKHFQIIVQNMEVITVGVILNDVTMIILNGKLKWSKYLICMNTLLKRKQSLQPLSSKAMP
jgi:hypothetical protein